MSPAPYADPYRKAIVNAEGNVRAQLIDVTRGKAFQSHTPLSESLMKPRQSEVFRELMTNGFEASWKDEGKIARSDGLFTHQGGEPGGVYRAVYSAGVKKLSQGKLREARLIFEFVANHCNYLGGEGKNGFPDEPDFANMVRDVAVISRAIVVSDACEYFGIKTEGFEAVRWKEPIYGSTHLTFDPAESIITLRRFGGLEDIIPIAFVGTGCREAHMENYCFSATQEIISRIPLLFMDLNEKESGLDRWRLERAIGVLLNYLGMTNVFTHLPGFCCLPAVSVNPVLCASR
ncbi:MAG: hypothetical protein V1909_06085 [Candidatus Micrarchaeota archaeon]